MEISNVKKTTSANTDISSKNGWNYDKSYYRLKYFYHINIDELLSKAELISSEYSSAPVFETFFALFKQILASCKLYHSFLTDEGPHNESFFGEVHFYTHKPVNSSVPYNIHYNEGFSDLIKIALMNYCVTQSFYIFAPKDSQNYIKLSGRFHEQYYGCDNDTGDKDSKDDKSFASISAQYTNRYAKFSKNSFFRSYISRMPYEQCFIRKSEKNPNKKRLSLSPYFAEFGFFAFYENDIFNFYKYINSLNTISPRQTISILAKYNTVLKHIYNHQNLLKEDKSETPALFTFANAAQYFFAADTFTYIQRVYTAFDLPEKNADDNYLSKLKALDGNTLLKEFLNVLKMPNVFSRHFFLDIALRSIANAETAPRYLRNPDQPNQMMFLDHRYLKDAKQYDAFLAFNAPQLLSNYIQHLTQLLFPLLLDLWYVTLHNIYGNKDAFSLVKQYCIENSSLILSDFTKLTVQNIQSIGKAREDEIMRASKDAPMEGSYQVILQLCKNQLSTSNRYDFPGNLSSDSQKKIVELIKNFIPIDPYFYPHDNDISSKIFLPYPDNLKSTKENDLIQKHISNLFNTIIL